MKQRAGIPIEILAAMPCPDHADGRKSIGEAHRLAGEQYAELVQRWRRLHQVPDDTRQRAGVGRGDDVDPRHVQTVDARMAEVQAALDKLPPFSRAVIEEVCVREYMGRCADRSPLGARLRAALREGLDALCGVFRVASRRAA